MKTSSSSSKNSSAPSINSKSKKNSKDREKRKSSGPDKIDQQSNDKGSPNKDGGLRKYAGIGPDSILIYSEQSTFEHLSDEVCYGLAEDISYKLRYVIHDALIKARLSGRNHILSSDIEATFEDLSIDKVYGATSTPNWISFGEHNLYYLDDPVVNLIELAEQECSYIQPGEVLLMRKWLSDGKEISKPLKNYFETMCLAVVSQDVDVRKFALKDISENNLIGPIVEWFYHFGYFLLSKDITYDCLTLRALHLIRALEKSHVAPLIVSEKQLKLLVRLILQRLLRSVTTVEVLKPMCYMLAILCDRIPIRELVMIKISQKICAIEEDFVLSIISIINALGIYAIQDVFLPNIEFFLQCAEKKFEAEFLYALLQTYSIVCRHTCIDTRKIHESFTKVFGNSVSPIWINHRHFKKASDVEANWFNIKCQLLKSRRKLYYTNKSVVKPTIKAIFPEYFQGGRTLAHSSENYVEEEEEGNREQLGQNATRFTFKRSFIKYKFDAKNETSRLISILKNEMDIYNPDSCLSINFISQLMDTKPKFVMVGKRSLLIPVLKGSRNRNYFSNRCDDHSLMYYNL